MPIKINISEHGGDDGSRTRVRKPLDMTFFADSLLFKIPFPKCEQTHLPSR